MHARISISKVKVCVCSIQQQKQGVLRGGPYAQQSLAADRVPRIPTASESKREEREIGR